MSEKLIRGDEDLEGCEGVRPMVDWVKEVEAETGICSPCRLAVIAPWYRELLKETGYPDLSERVQELAEVEELKTERVAELLDQVKDEVGDERVRKTLILYDCMAQTYQEESDEDQHR